MNKQHTPGPWNVGDDSPNDYEGPIIDTRDRAVAVITIDHETESTPEDRANARLIAAAPELLAMLERVLDGVLRLPELPGTLCPLDIEQALAAIAKATRKP